MESGDVAESDGLERLVRSAAVLRWELVPNSARRHTALVLADTLGVIMAGARRTEVAAYVSGEAGEGKLCGRLPTGPAQILDGALTSVEAATAAFVNGTAGTFLELDEGYRPTGHPGVHVIPAALAAAQALHSSGIELLTATLAGYEVTARLFEAYQLTYPLHPHGHFGAVGAALAVALLRGVDPLEPACIAATLPLLPVWQACFEGATARNAWAGSAAALGIAANRMATAGFTGARGALDVTFGELVGHPRDVSSLSRHLDHADLAITQDYLKLHSACALSHAALDAVLTIAPDVDIASVSHVVVETVSNNLKINRQPRPNSLSTRFSLPYSVAAALVHGHTGPEAFEPDERVLALARRVEVRAADDLERHWPDRAPARVIVQTTAGERTVQVDNPRGHHANPAGDEELRRKFMMLCPRLDAEALLQRLLDVAAVPDCARLLA
ncbi:MAG: MmgE/PrpD family protein [Candidatus Dormibacteria bacterium]